MERFLGADVMQQQTITCWMWPEWMIDDSFCVSPLTITQMRERRFPVHPIEARDSDVQTLAAERDSRSIWSKRLHFVPSPRDRYSENKVFSHSESSLNDIVVYCRLESMRSSYSVKMLQELWSFSEVRMHLALEWRSLKRWPPVVFEEDSMMNDLMWMNR